MLTTSKFRLFLICVITAIFIASIAFLKKTDVEKKKQVESFFKVLVYENHFGYTLFGDKPVSIAGYFTQEPLSNFFWGRSNHSNLGELWKIWESYQKTLNIKEYIFLNEADVDLDNLRVITLINKKAFLAKVKQHIELFQAVLGNNITPELLLERVSAPHSSLFKHLNCNEGLYGILLGYGRNNAFAFKRSLELAKIVDPVYRDCPIHFSLFFPRPSKGFSSLSEEYESLRTKLFPFTHQHKLSQVLLPQMVVLEDDDETINLRKKYRELHRKIVQTYLNNDFLEITFKQLCS